jgi:TonB family protein
MTSSPRVASASVSSAIEPLLEPIAVHQEFPDIPERAKRTIRGTVRVSVRVIVNEDGTVFAALTDDRGPSRYFERLAIEAAKKWTFNAADGADQRIMLIRFAFSRDNDTANAIALK